MPLDADASAIYYDFIMPTRSMLGIFSVSSIGISFLGVGFASALLAALFFPLFTSPVADEQLHDSVEQAVDYLKGQYSTEYHLIPESPIVCTTRFWLANDNWLAARALTAGGDTDLAPQLSLTVSSLMTQSHGIIEALDGEEISWPPRTPRETPPCNFVTLYNPTLPLNQNNTNTETTSYALLALAAILSDDSSQSR